MSSEIIGVAVLVHDACLNCGGNACFVDRGPAPLYRQLRFDACETARGYVSKELRDRLEKFVRKSGWPDQPIVLRTGKVWSPEPREIAAETVKRKRKRKGIKMKMTDLFPSKYLKAADLRGQPRVVTIEKVEHVVFKDDGTDVLKAVLHFKEKDSRPVVVNKSNFAMLTEICGSDDDERWPGHKVELRVRKSAIQGWDRGLDPRPRGAAA
jgi:hypothetical protein